MNWDPTQYQKFQKEREEPFSDLLELICVGNNMRILDVGCGDGKITLKLHQALYPCETWGIDASDKMIQEATKLQEEGLSFSLIPFDEITSATKFDLIFSNACLQWVPDHFSVFAKLAGLLKEHGQLAIQMPYNFDYPTHTIAAELAQEKAYRSPVLKPEVYAQILYDLGFSTQCIRLQVYGHELASTSMLLEWVKGSLLSHYRAVMNAQEYSNFLSAYQQKLLSFFGEKKPFFFPMKRILIWAQKV